MFLRFYKSFTVHRILRSVQPHANINNTCFHPRKSSMQKKYIYTPCSRILLLRNPLIQHLPDFFTIPGRCAFLTDHYVSRFVQNPCRGNTGRVHLFRHFTHRKVHRELFPPFSFHKLLYGFRIFPVTNRKSTRSPYESYKRCKAGISAIQGGHHVAQKFTSTTRPLASLNRTTHLPLFSGSNDTPPAFPCLDQVPATD